MPVTPEQRRALLRMLLGGGVGQDEDPDFYLGKRYMNYGGGIWTDKAGNITGTSRHEDVPPTPWPPKEKAESRRRKPTSTTKNRPV